MIKKLFFILLFIYSSTHLYAQQDTSFWFVAPNISATMGDNPIGLNIQTSSLPSTVYVRQPANLAALNFSFVIAANTTTLVNLTPSITAIESSPTNSVSNKGIYISATNPINAYYSINSATNKELLSLKGKRALGTDFYLPFPNTYSSATTFTDAGVGFDIVATSASLTTVLITPRAACVGRAKNVTFAITLNQGETFSMKDNGIVNPSELAGSIVSADRNIALTINGAVKTNTSCNSYFADQITNSSEIGKDYVLIKGNALNEVAYILAPENGTSLSITTPTGTINWLINSAETYSVNISDLTYIKTGKPTYLYQMAGYGCKMSGAQLPAAYCAGSYTNSFVRLSSDSLNLHLYTRNGNQGTFTLTSNGTPVPISPLSFTTVPGTSGDLVAARLYFTTAQIAVGSHNVIKNANDLFGVGARNGLSTSGSAYAFGSEFGSETYVKASAVPSATICGNTTYNLAGIIGGGPNTGVWSYNGFGTFGSPLTTYTSNVYTPALIDTLVKPTPTTVGGIIKFVLTSTGICPNKTDSFKLHIKQAPIVNAGLPQTICSNNGTVQLGGNVISSSNQGIWNSVAPANGTFVPGPTVLNSIYNLSNSDTSMTLIKLVLTSTNTPGCNNVKDTLKVTIKKAPKVYASSINPILRCANNPTVFLTGIVSGTTTSTGQWQTFGSGVFIPNNLSLINNYIPSPADITAGTVKLKLTSTNNQQCKPVSDSVNVIFTQPPSVTVGPDLNSCKNLPIVSLSAIISGTATSTGVWYGGGGTFTNSPTSLTPTYIATPTETLNGFVVLNFSTTANGLCLGVSDQVKIDFRDEPSANFTVSPVCLNQPSNFIDLSLNSYPTPLSSWQWDFGNGVNSTSVNPITTYSTPGTYSVTLEVKNNYGCANSATRIATVYGLPTASFAISRECSGSAQKINFTDLSTIQAPGSILTTGYYWDFGGFGFSFAKDTSIIFPSQGIYNITHVVTSTNNCQTSITKSVNITPRPVAKFIYSISNLVSLTSNVAFIDSSTAAVSWNWNFGNGEVSTIQNPNTTYTVNGTYTVGLSITDQFGCVSTFTNLVKINNIASEITKLIPNIISPNNDSKNDIWRLDFIDVYYPKAEISIFNRWGEELFKSTGYSNAWDGSYKGNPLPVGAYFYVIKLNDNESRIFKGTVTLLK
jgi:gliding motility-associated-like protein